MLSKSYHNNATLETVRGGIIKNNTCIIFVNYASESREWTKEEWDNMIDSLQPYDTKNTQVDHIGRPV